MTRKVFLCLTFVYVFFVTDGAAQIIENPGRQLSCWPEKIKFEDFKLDFIFSSRNKKNQLLKYGSVLGPEDVDFDPRRRTAVIVHGLQGSTDEVNVRKLTKELLKLYDINVIAVDWRQGCANILVYQQAVANTEFVAIAIKLLFNQFVKTWANTEKSREHWGPIHFIGQSLGAHIVGQAAELLKKEHGILIDRVTGLDPAEPCFENANSPLRLKQTNARFVDVIHSDAARNQNEGFGIAEPMGHADFYLNGGNNQPGCNWQSIKRNLSYDRIVLHAINNGGCHHRRAFEVFNESVRQARINKCKFWAHPWTFGSNSAQAEQILKNGCYTGICIEMGINAELYKYTYNKTYYVATTGKAPFCNI